MKMMPYLEIFGMVALIDVWIDVLGGLYLRGHALNTHLIKGVPVVVKGTSRYIC